MLYIVLLWYLIINIVSFVMYGRDKKKAVNGEWRTPEQTLLLTGGLGGGIGSLAGMKIFHHKTKKPLFRILVPFFLILHILIFVYLVATDFEFIYALIS